MGSYAAWLGIKIEHQNAELTRLRADNKKLLHLRDMVTKLFELPGRTTEPERESAHWEVEEALRGTLHIVKE